MNNNYHDDNLFYRIGTGKKNALTRPANEMQDRRLRKMIEEAQGKGDIIINLGEGYYRPDLCKPEEAEEYRHYINQKRSRIRAQLATVTAMEAAAEKIMAAIEE